MRHSRLPFPLVFFVLSFLTTACSGTGTPTAPSSPPPSPTTSTAVTLMSVSPQGGATGVLPSAAVSFAFGGPLAAGMEQYCDLHAGGLEGSVVPMACGWSLDRTTLTCRPGEPLQDHAHYTVHLGGGLRDASGNPVGFEAHGPMLGGQWIQGGQMPGVHGGPMGWGMMGAGWRHENGSFGMAFSFTTAQ